MTKILSISASADNPDLTNNGPGYAVKYFTSKAPIKLVATLFGLFLLNACAPSVPGELSCIGDSCKICTGWDCYNSFINKDHPRPKSPQSRDAVAQCYQSVDPMTRKLANGHFEPLARVGLLSWGPARRWTYSEAQAWDGMTGQVKACMAKQQWVYCCKGRTCDRNRFGNSPSLWICQREP